MSNTRMGDVIEILSPNDYSIVEYEKGAEYLSPKVQIISESDIPDVFSDIDLEGIKKDQLCKGDILIRHPFKPKTYTLGQQCEESILKGKLFVLAQIFKDLGATSVHYDYTIKETKKLTLEANGKIGVKGIGIKGMFSSKKNEKYSFVSTMDEHYDGGEPDLESAINRAKKFDLYTDDQVRHFIEQRKGIHKQKGLQQYKMSLTNELNDLKKATMSLNYLKAFKLDGSFSHKLETFHSVELNIDVTYPQE